MTVVSRLLAVLRGRRLDAELDAEIVAHIELAEKDAIDAGLSPIEARRVARLKFGGITNVKEEHRDRRSVRWIETFARDLRYGVAALIRDPSFSLIAIGVLALGIGANTAMFSLVDATLLRPLPFPEPERIVRVWEAPDLRDFNSINTMDLLDWMRLNTVFEAFSAEADSSLALTGEGDPAQLDGRLVSPDYFDVFGVDAAMGRTFAPGEDEPGSMPVVVLSHATWQTRFGGDPDIVNREITLDKHAHTIIGVLAPGAFDRDDALFWKPLIYTPDRINRNYHWLRAVARLKPEISLAQAQEEMSAIDASLTDLSPSWKKDWGVVVEPYDRRLVDDSLRRSIEVAFGAVALVLLIACANVANLLLGKGAARRKEMAVRAALGASRGRLIGQLLTESLALCLLGGLAGIGVAHLLVQLATPLLADSLPFTAEVSLDPRVLGFSAAAALGVSLLVGLLPSWQTSFARLSQSMKQGSRGSSGSRDGLRRTLVIGEVAISLVLICGSLLLFKSLFQLQQVEAGARVNNVITMSIDLPESAYPTPEGAVSFYRTVIGRLQAIPSVVSASVASDLPLDGIQNGQGMGVPGGDGSIDVSYKRIDANYFETMDVALLTGEGIKLQDSEGASQAVVLNEEAAASLMERFDVDDPIGATVWISTPNYQNSNGDGTDYTVAGIIHSERTEDLNGVQQPVVYVALAQVPLMGIKIVVQTRSEPTGAMPAIREAVRQIDPTLPIGNIRTMKQIRDRSLTGAKQPTWVIGAFAAVAALLAALGLYGVLAHSVTQRRREIGIRMALGAQSGDVLSQVLRNGMSLVGIGVAIGLAGALAMTRVIESLLFEVSTVDPLAIAGACIAMLLVGLLAGFIPARRAARVEPMTALREEG